MPLSKAESFFGTDQCDRIIVKLDTSDKATVTNISRTISQHFSDQVTVISSTAVIDQLNIVFNLLQLFLGGIAAISPLTTWTR